MKRCFLIFCGLMLLNSCVSDNLSNTFSLRSYNDYEEYFIETEQIFNQEENDYLIYFFSMYCNACYDLKQKIFDYIDNKHPLYFVDCSKQDIYRFVKDGTNIPDEVIKNSNFHATSVQAITISSIPCLLKVKEHKVENTWIGFQECNEILKETT